MTSSSGPEVLTHIRELLVQAGHVSDTAAIGADSKLAELKLDSLDLLEFLMLVEERTGVEVVLDELTAGITLGELSALISARAA